MKEQMKRVDINARVQFDATGTGDWDMGFVSDIDRRNGKVAVRTRTGEVIIGREHLHKVSKKEFEEKFNSEATVGTSESLDDADSGTSTDSATESNEDTSETRSIIKRRHRQRYVTTKVDGERHTDSGDGVATMLRGLSLDQALQSIADCMGESPELYLEKWGHLNPGQIRMNAGNRLRHWLKKTGHTI